MQAIQAQASEMSGVDPADAFALDEVEVSLYDRLGHDFFVKLSTEFYTRVYADEEEWFRGEFKNSKIEDAIQNQYEFFIQRMGGPPLFSERKGHPALIGRHADFSVTERHAARWLEHMEAAVGTFTDLDEDSRHRMMSFLRHTAYFLVAGQEVTKKRAGQ